MTKALVLCCHGIFHPAGYFIADPRYIDEESPSIEIDKIAIYFEQMMTAARLLRSGEYDHLIISGGHTKPEIAPELSEARTYWNVMRYLLSKNETKKVILESYSRDSFENILFSMLEHWACVGIFPDTLDVISWKFKGERIQLILDALHIKGQVIGVGEISGLVTKSPTEIANEIRNDPLHRTSDFAKKRQERTVLWSNPFNAVLNPKSTMIVPVEIRNMLETLNQMEKDDNSQLPPGFKFPWEK